VGKRTQGKEMPTFWEISNAFIHKGEMEEKQGELLGTKKTEEREH